ncbi:hypothetical protein AGMMS50284_6000 [Clostridia bacterium]|nr:hypothetical protein AGMMS50284_6000 [Clostridia bacterium]
MTLTEKVAYIKGLTDGLKLDEKKDEVKVINAIIELLEDLALSVYDVEETLDEVAEQVDAIDADLAELEEDFTDLLEDEFDDDEDDDLWDDDDEEAFYEVVCPSCGEEICVEEDTLFEGEIKCPECGENLEFDFSDLHDEECGCGCFHGTEEDEDLAGGEEELKF